MHELTVGSLFSGIGGLELGFERAGMRTEWLCELDPYCRRVLAQRFAGVPQYLDVRELRSPPAVDVLCGGFPCQDISIAGSGAGVEAGERSGLWREFARLIGELRPRYVIVENVPALTYRGLDRVLADLAASGLDAEWDHLPASAFGAPHRRDRLWLVAYTPDAELPRLEGLGRDSGQPQEPEPRDGGAPAGGGCPYCAPDELCALCWRRDADADHWHIEPDVGRVADGIPARVDRLRCLGNAVVPQIAEWIGRRVVSYEASRGR